MKKHKNIFLITLVITTIFVSCDKSNPPTPLTPLAKCFIKTESGLSGSLEYEFDDKGNLSLIKVIRPNGSIERTIEFGSQTITQTYTYLGKTNRRITHFDVSDIFTELPTKAFVSVDFGDTIMVNFYTYFFFYNSKNQLIKVGEQTDYVIGDWEYDLNIYYNDQGNVTALQSEWTTGPNQVIPPVTVTAYDDKPTPYAAIKGMPFLLINYGWDNSDPEPILTALSKNNPLNYSLGTGTNLFTREMVYTYNNDGFPIERKSTNKNINGEYTFLQGYTYTCE